ncbi:DUF3566 domain-containing protein [Tsukamurella soli]|uniref:DUF3566 domain-containing protein n=1 Tax=Tsukamurella soli TaxID=644556 RepID=A0ABP8J2L7_9ACTN
MSTPGTGGQGAQSGPANRSTEIIPPVGSGSSGGRPVPPGGVPVSPDGAPRVPRRDTPVGRAVDAKTSSVERDDVPRDLPDLDKIHHVTAQAPSAAGRVGVTSGPDGAGRVPTAVGPAVVGVDAPGVSPSGTPTRAAAERVAPGTLRASMQLRHIDPWTTFKLSLVVSVVLFFVWMIAVGALYIVLDGMGVWARLNNSFSTLVNDQTGASLVSSGDVFGWAALVGIAYVVLFTALCTVGAFIYNLCSELVGGVEVTLADRD